MLASTPISAKAHLLDLRPLIGKTPQKKGTAILAPLSRPTSGPLTPSRRVNEQALHSLRSQPPSANGKPLGVAPTARKTLPPLDLSAIRASAAGESDNAPRLTRNGGMSKENDKENAPAPATGTTAKATIALADVAIGFEKKPVRGADEKTELLRATAIPDVNSPRPLRRVLATVHRAEPQSPMGVELTSLANES